MSAAAEHHEPAKPWHGEGSGPHPVVAVPAVPG